MRPSLALFLHCTQPGPAPAKRNCSWASKEGKGSRKHEPTLGELEGHLSQGQMHTKCIDEDLEQWRNVLLGLSGWSNRERKVGRSEKAQKCWQALGAG